MLIMWITKRIAARTLIWLAAVTVPVQGLPAAACGCTSGRSCCQKDEKSGSCCCAAKSHASGKPQHSCCQQRSADRCRCTGAKVGRCGESSPCRKQSRSCCAERVATGTRCAANNSDTFGVLACKCGVNCQCGTSKEPREPVAPPVENNNPTEKMASDSGSIARDATAHAPQITQRHADACVEADALTALDRCASLCRFTL